MGVGKLTPSSFFRGKSVKGIKGFKERLKTKEEVEGLLRPDVKER